MRLSRLGGRCFPLLPLTEERADTGRGQTWTGRETAGLPHPCRSQKAMIIVVFVSLYKVIRPVSGFSFL